MKDPNVDVSRLLYYTTHVIDERRRRQKSTKASLIRMPSFLFSFFSSFIHFHFTLYFLLPRLILYPLFSCILSFFTVSLFFSLFFLAYPVYTFSSFYLAALSHLRFPSLYSSSPTLSLSVCLFFFLFASLLLDPMSPTLELF